MAKVGTVIDKINDNSIDAAKWALRADEAGPPEDPDLRWRGGGGRVAAVCGSLVCLQETVPEGRFLFWHTISAILNAREQQARRDRWQHMIRSFQC